MTCINLKQKVNRTLYCKYLKSDIKISNCANCKYKEYKAKPINKIKSKSSKVARLERNRFSILTNDLEHCIICGKPKDNLHEVFFGTSRQLSMKYGIVIPLCIKCHEIMHINKDWQDVWKKKGQLAFIEHYPNLDFVKIFRRNYL